MTLNPVSLVAPITFVFPLVEEDAEQSVEGPDDIMLMGLVIKKN